MTTYEKYRMECGERVLLFCQQPGLLLTPIESAITTALGTHVTAMRGRGVGQVSGKLAFRDGALDRQSVALTIYGKLRSISRMAVSMELAGISGVTRAAFRLPAQRTYAVLAATAQAFADHADPHKAKFIERGMAATFVEDLEALIPLLSTAGDDRASGLIKQTVGTAGLDALAASVLKLIQQLRPIMEEHFRDDPAMLGAWKLAARVASRRSAAPSPAPSGSGTATGTPPPPPAGS